MRNGISTALVAAALAMLSGCEGGQHAGMRYQLDASRERAWWLTRDGVVVKNVRAMERISVPIPGWTWAAEPWSCMPDLALGPRGEALVTSNVLPVVWKIDPETLAVTEHPLVLDADTDKDVGFSGLTYSSEHDAYFAVSGAHGTLWKIDAQLSRGEKVVQSGPIYNACRVAISGRALSQAGGRAQRIARGASASSR
jgi:hypothetical protein